MDLYQPKAAKRTRPQALQTSITAPNACKSGVPQDMKRADRLLRDFSGEKK